MRNRYEENSPRWLICACCLVGLFLFASTALSAFPERPITLVVGSEPGGPIDLAARALAASSEKYLGKPIVVENKGGGGGTVAAAIVATAKPDGYTLCATPNISFGNTPLMQKVTFKPLKSFENTQCIGGYKFTNPMHQYASPVQILDDRGKGIPCEDK